MLIDTFRDYPISKIPLESKNLEKAESLYESALTAYSEKRYRDASELYRELLTLIKEKQR